MNEAYLATVRLLLAIAPTVLQSPRLAMKGGTALNLFVQDLPRLSVDIDVAYVDHSVSREVALEDIAAALLAAKAALEAQGYRVDILPASRDGEEAKLLGVQRYQAAALSHWPQRMSRGCWRSIAATSFPP